MKSKAIRFLERCFKAARNNWMEAMRYYSLQM